MQSEDPKKIVQFGDPKTQETPPPKMTFEARWMLFYAKNKGLLYKTLWIAIIVFIGYQTFLLHKDRRVQSMQAAYNLAQTDEQKLKFAETYPSYPLAGLIFLSNADRAYEAKNYENALKFYERAEKSLQNNDWIYRATIGRAVCAICLDKDAIAIQLLEKVVQNPKIVEIFKVQAIYFLGLAYYKGANYPACKKTLDLAKTLSNQEGFFLQKIQRLRESVDAKH